MPVGTPVVLDGFEYDEIAGLGEVPQQNHEDEQKTNRQARENSPRTELSDRLSWLENGTRSVRGSDGGYIPVQFTPQPYQQLAAVYQRIGQDRAARKVLHKMYQQRNSVKTPRGFSKLWNWIQDLFLGYGYVPGRAFGWLLLLALLSALWFGIATRIGIAKAFLMPLGLVLPGSGYERIAPWDVHLTPWSHLIAALLVLCGLLLGATVLAALARIIKR